MTEHTDLPWDALVQRAAANTAALSAAAVWRRDGPRAEVDLDAGTVVFSGERFRTTAALQVSGTLDRAAGTWLWAWDHPSVPAALAQHAGLVRAYGERSGVEALTSRLVRADEADAARFTDVTGLLGGATGVGVVDAGSALLWFTHGQVRLAAPDGAPGTDDGSAPAASWHGPEWMRDARWVTRGSLEDPVPMQESGIPASGPWLAGTEPHVSAEQVVAFVQEYNRRMQPLYRVVYDDDGELVDPGPPDAVEQQAALREAFWRRTDSFHRGAVQGDDDEYDLAVAQEWSAVRVAPRTWQVTWATPKGPLGLHTRGVVVVAFDDGLRIVDLLEPAEYH